MSHHILHIFNHGTVLTKDRGRLVARATDQPTRSLPIEDIRALIVAAQGVTFSSNVLAEMIEMNVIILHCGKNYQPIGRTAGLSRTTRSNALLHQVEMTPARGEQLWKNILRSKVINQSEVISRLEGLIGHRLVFPYRKQLNVDESTSSRTYWSYIFGWLKQLDPSCEWFEGPTATRSERTVGALNGALNYGYAVLSALIHRSILIYGLIPQLGIHHKFRFRSYPLVYDLMEPFRPVVDWFLIQHISSCGTVEDWPKKVANGLREQHMIFDSLKFEVKVLDAIDFMVREFATAVIEKKSALVKKMPKLAEISE